MNEFVNMGENLTHSQEGSLKTRHLNNEFVEQFSNISRYREERNFSEVSEDMKKLWAIDPLLTCKFVLYLRMITRKQTELKNDFFYPSTGWYKCTGAGLKHESLFRMYWMGLNYPEYFYALLPMFIYIGSWKDLFQLWRIDIIKEDHSIYLDWNKFLNMIKIGINDDLMRKYLPAYVCSKKRTTDLKKANSIIAKFLMNKLFNEEKDNIKRNILYRKLKNGKAYDWQVKISKQMYDDINFDTIAGRALMLLTNGNFLKNHNLEEKFFEWIKSKPMAKFTGYVYELFKNYRINYPEWKKYLINKQFETLLADGKESMSDLLVVIDTSGSMTGYVPGTNVSSYIIARALALYFSYSLKGEFANSFAFFSDKCELRKWVGETPVEKWEGNYGERRWNNTDFQKVIDLFVTLKKRGVPETDFPKGILCISDGEFQKSSDNMTEFEHAIEKLKETGFSKEFCDNFRIILWDIFNDFYPNYNKERTFEGNGYFIYMAGFDANNVRFLFNEESDSKSQPKSTEEVFENAMNQDILQRVYWILKGYTADN